jgi:hypothetical protein
MMANLLSAVPPCVSAYLFESERERNREREKETERERESERVCVGMYVCAPVLCRHGLVVGQGQEPRLDHTAETLLVGREKRGREPQAEATERHGRALGVTRCRCDAAQLDQA